MAYFEICQNTKKDWYSELVPNKGTFATKGKNWVSYNCIGYVAEKANYVNSQDYSGVAVFTVDMDDFNNECCDGAYPLLNTLSKHLRGIGGLSKNCQKPPQVHFYVH